MARSVREQIAEINDVGDALRLIAALEEINCGALRLASGVVRGMLTFEYGHITSARLTSKGTAGVKALEEMLALPDAAFQFLPPEDSMAIGEADKICVDIKALIANNLSLKGLATESRAIGQTASPPQVDANPTQVPPAFRTAPEEPKATPAPQPPAAKVQPTVVPEVKADEMAAFFGAEGEDDRNETSEISKFVAKLGQQNAPERDDQMQDVTGPVPVFDEDEDGWTSVDARPPVVEEQPPVQINEEEAVALLKDETSLMAPVEGVEIVADAKSAFEKEEHILDTREASLSDDQKTLLEQVSKLQDEETFEKADPGLIVVEEGLSDQKLEILERVQVDQEGKFEEVVAGEALTDNRSLSEDQKLLLETVQKLADPTSFNTTEVKIEEAGQVVSDAERWMIEQNASLLSPEEQLEEFLKTDEELQKAREQSVEFKPFVDKNRLSEGDIPDSEFDAASLDAIAPEVEEGDFAPLIAMPEDQLDGVPKKREASKGIIGRVGYVWGKLPTYTRTVKKQLLAPEKIIGPIIFCSLSLALFILPGYLKKTLAGNQSEELAAQQMQLTIAEEMEDQVPYAINEPEQNPYFDQPQGSSSGAGGGGPSSGSNPELGGNYEASGEGALRQARALAAKGWTKRALALFRDYLLMNPRAFAVRIELIKLLIGGKEKNQAAAECIDAMKLKPNAEQMQEIYNLFQQCT